MSKHVATTAEAELSPKVVAGAAVGLLVTVVSVVLAGVTPEMLEALGPWAVPVAAGLVAGGGYLAGYLKRDPLREAGGAVVAAGTVTPEAPAASVGVQAAVAEDAQPAPVEGVSVAEATAEANALAARAASLRREV